MSVKKQIEELERINSDKSTYSEVRSALTDCTALARKLHDDHNALKTSNREYEKLASDLKVMLEDTEAQLKIVRSQKAELRDELAVQQMSVIESEEVSMNLESEADYKLLYECARDVAATLEIKNKKLMIEMQVLRKQLAASESREKLIMAEFH
jgi:SMC interacting uncharacterized protein involved in chromosome segregation